MDLVKAYQHGVLYTQTSEGCLSILLPIDSLKHLTFEIVALIDPIDRVVFLLILGPLTDISTCHRPTRYERGTPVLQPAMHA